MSIPNRTQTVPNHTDGHRDVRWGWDAVIPMLVQLGGVLSLIALVIGAWVSINREVASNRAEQLADQRNLANTIAAAILANERLRPSLTWDEWKELNETQAQAIEKRLGAIEGHLSRLDDRDRHQLGIIEKLPGARDPR